MKAGKLLLCSVIIGVLAAIVMLVTNIMQINGIITPNAGLTFVSFLAWSSYFFCGATPQNAVKAWLSFIVGIACAILIFLLTDLFASGA